MLNTMTDTPETMGKLITQLREESNLSMRELASRAGVWGNTIGNIERGYVKTSNKAIRPDRDTITNIATILGIDEKRMFDAYGLEGPRFVRFNVDGLSPTQVEQVRGYIDGLREK